MRAPPCGGHEHVLAMHAQGLALNTAAEADILIDDTDIPSTGQTTEHETSRCTGRSQRQVGADKTDLMPARGQSEADIERRCYAGENFCRVQGRNQNVECRAR